MDETVRVNVVASHPQAKVGRARQHGMDLQGRIAAWRGSVALQPVAVIAADRLSWELRLSDFDEPALLEWALIFGDAIHNLRSALDVLVWSFVDEQQLTEGQKKQIAFPVHSTVDDWERDSPRRLRTVPADIIERIRKCQPFMRPEPERAGDALALLTALDNQDKHRLIIKPMVHVSQVDFSSSVQFHDETAAERNIPPDIEVHVASLRSGELLLSGRTLDPIARIGGAVSLQAQFAVEVAGAMLGITDLVNNLAQHADQIVTHVAGP